MELHNIILSNITRHTVYASFSSMHTDQRTPHVNTRGQAKSVVTSCPPYNNKRHALSIQKQVSESHLITVVTLHYNYSYCYHSYFYRCFLLLSQESYHADKLQNMSSIPS